MPLMKLYNEDMPNSYIDTSILGMKHEHTEVKL